MSTVFSDERLDLEMRKFLASESADTRWAPSALEMAERIATPRVIGTANTRLLLVAALVALLGVIALSAVYFGSRLNLINDSDVVVPPTRLLPTNATPTSAPIQNGWIAFSTEPYNEPANTDSGGDIYLVRPGVPQILIASRGDTHVSNICPTWSPDGSTLAYGRRDGVTMQFVLVDIWPDGSAINTRTLAVPPTATSPCPRWSADGSYIAFPLGPDGAPPKAGSTSLPALDLNGQPVVGATADLDPSTLPCASGSVMECNSSDLVSQSTGLVAQRSVGCQASVSGADRSPVCLTLGAGNSLIGYSFGPWSPDGTQILLSYDSVDNLSVLFAAPVDGTTSPTRIATGSVNSSRGSSFPGRLDISWQPLAGPSTHDPLSTALAPPSPSPVGAALPVSGDGPQPIDAGTYAASSPFLAPFTVTVPDGWSGNIGGPYAVFLRQRFGVAYLDVSIFDKVYADPCHVDRGLMSPLPGESVDDLVTALTTMPSMTSSPVEDVTFGGLPAKRFVLTAPDRSTSCTLTEDGQFRLWELPLGATNDMDPADSQQISILDVDGQRVVVDNRNEPGDAQLARVLDSISFMPQP